MKYLYTALFLLCLSQGTVWAQEKESFFDKIKIPSPRKSESVLIRLRTDRYIRAK